MNRDKPCVFLVDDDPATEAALRGPLEASGLRVEVTHDNLIAIEKLKTERYCAVVLDPMIRHRLNGYAVLGYIEQEQPELMDRVFLSTAMPRQTIARTAPALLSRLFRKPGENAELLDAVAAAGMPPRYLDDIDQQPVRGILTKPIDLRALRRVLHRCGEISVAEGGGEYPAMS